VSQAVQRAEGSGWETYAQLARELDAVRAAEAARTAGIRQAVAQMSEHADGLEARLQVQQGNLTQLGRQLRFRTGKLQAEKVEPVIEPAPLLSEVAADIDLVDKEATEAADRGRYPALLPRWSPFTRNLLIYGVAAAAVVAGQVYAFFHSDLGQAGAEPTIGSGAGPNPLVVLFVIPLVGFLLGYVAASVAGRPRVAESRVRLNPRLGLLLCFGVGPAIIAGLVIHSFTSR
jgi:hypothetical protein